MNAPHEESWDALDTLWRSQTVAPPDLDRLQREARVRGWRLQAIVAIEWLSLLVVTAMVWRFVALKPGWQTIDTVVLALYACAVAFTLWTARNRRGLWQERALAPRALVEREIERARSSLRFWSMNSRVTGLMFVVLAAATLAETAGVLAPPGRGSWSTVALINLPLVIVSRILHRRRSRTLGARLERLRGLAEQLDA
ncbi:hypothetical protein [Cognatilysobacter bugurensis]|uniref:Uncharacterized protein n=1 Tax=Cognatilysobacter bugurensis TaxID=543356 RepID=A0A918SZF5_9GAMM|nr:hypothetical protein [Lysobacter bugurensis]GHA80190.1 hypothetical protein GCM10007067_17360 [Lysobacter bugurensis]